MVAAAKSLKARLLGLLLLPLIVGLTAVGGIALYNATREISAVDDAQLLSNAKILRALIFHELLEGEEEDLHLIIETTMFNLPYERVLAYRVWRGKELVLRSDNSVTFPASPAPAGYSTQIVAGVPWRFCVISDRNMGVQTEVAERVAVRRQLSLRILFSIFAPIVFLIPLVLGIFAFGLSRGLRPIGEISREVGIRSVQHMQPVRPARVPAELLPLVRAINSLLLRLKDAFERERQFTDDAAHELRTPLAVMKTQAQVVAMAATAEERQPLLNDLNAGVDRAARIVDQLLELARLESGTAPDQTFNLTPELEAAANMLAEACLAKNVTVQLDVPVLLEVRGGAEAAGILLRNILDNAVKFSPKGGLIVVSGGARADGVVLHISDNGPGVAAEHREAVFERFTRLGDADIHGAGLGLTIARRVAELHGATITLLDNDAGSGLTVEVWFPPVKR